MPHDLTSEPGPGAQAPGDETRARSKPILEDIQASPSAHQWIAETVAGNGRYGAWLKGDDSRPLPDARVAPLPWRVAFAAPDVPADQP